MTLEFFVKLGKIRLGLAGWVGVPRGSPEYGSLQLSIIPAFRQRPTDSRLPGASQVLINRALRDRATAGDLVLPQSQFVAQAQYFFELSHGQPFHGQCGPSNFQWNLTARDVVQRPSLSLIPESTGPGPYPPNRFASKCFKVCAAKTPNKARCSATSRRSRESRRTTRCGSFGP